MPNRVHVTLAVTGGSVALLLLLAGVVACSTTSPSPEDSSATKTSDKDPAVEAELAECKQLASAYDLTFNDLARGVGTQVNATELADQRMKAYRQAALTMREELNLAQADAGEFLIRRGRLVLVLNNALLFPEGTADLGADTSETLDGLARALAALPDRNVLIAGHTDDRPAAAKDKRFTSNRELSLTRAYQVASALEERGVMPGRMGRAGWGEHRPLSPGTDEVARTKNRRTEVIFLLRPDEIPTMPADTPLAMAAGGAQ